MVYSNHMLEAVCKSCLLSCTLKCVKFLCDSCNETHGDECAVAMKKHKINEHNTPSISICIQLG